MQVTAPPKGAPQGATAPQSAQAQGPGQGQAEQAIQMIQKGFEALGKMIQAAGQNLPPDDIKLFQMAVQATDNFIQAITGGGDDDEGQQAPPQKAPPGGPMADNANAKAQPAM